MLYDIARIIISFSAYQRYNNIPELFTFLSKLESIEKLFSLPINRPGLEYLISYCTFYTSKRR